LIIIDLRYLSIRLAFASFRQSVVQRRNRFRNRKISSGSCCNETSVYILRLKPYVPAVTTIILFHLLCCCSPTPLWVGFNQLQCHQSQVVEKSYNWIVRFFFYSFHRRKIQNMSSLQIYFFLGEFVRKMKSLTFRTIYCNISRSSLITFIMYWLSVICQVIRVIFIGSLNICYQLSSLMISHRRLL